jgi:hypothetical protein
MPNWTGRAAGWAAFLAGSLLGQAAAFAGDEAQLQPRSTLAVIVGVLEWKGKDLEPFSKENRRDQALHDRLLAMGVPAGQMKLLLDAQATEAAMTEAIERLAKAAPKDSTFIFYYAGHGYPGSRGICLANYDAGVNGTEGFFVDQLTAPLKRHFRGRRVLLFADCCYSGGLAEAAAELSRQGIAGACLTAASFAESSTGRWTFTCTLLDALLGRPLLDLDGDGYISLDETAGAARETMAHVERQNAHASLHGLNGTFRLAPVDAAAPKPAAPPEPLKLRDFVKVGGPGGKKTARIVDFQDGKVVVEVQRYHDRELRWHPAEDLAPMTRPPLPKVDLKPPVELEPDAAMEKARSGKYSGLERSLPARYDYLQYGEYHDYGFSKESFYLGAKDIPPGYWVYVYPRWYVFKTRS